MIKIATFTVNPFGENSYVLYNQSNKCIIVDAGFYNAREHEQLTSFLDKNNLVPTLALNTHAHIDHICGVEWAKSTFNIPFAMHKADMPVLEAVPSYGAALGFNVDTIPAVDRYITDGEVINFEGDTLRIIHTPGHTAGGVCIYIEAQKLLITGDTLFRESIGRTDLPTGDYDELMDSIIKKILPIGGDTTFFPGHGQHSTLAHETTQNPFVAEVLSGEIPFKQ